MQRRDALKLGLGAGATAVAAVTLRATGLGALREPGRQAPAPTAPAAQVAPMPPIAPHARLSIAPVDLELAPGTTVRSIAFNGTVPGPQLRATGAPPASLELRNDGDTDTVIHSSALAEPLINLPAFSSARVLLRAADEPAAGLHFKSYRAYGAATGAIASGIIAAGIEHDAGAFDRLQVLSIHRWQPRLLLRREPGAQTVVGYEYASFDDKVRSASEPIRVRYGDRVRFHFANANTLRGVTLGLAGHRFQVVALDGHPVPTPRHLDRIYLGPGESLDALVTMDRPGRWILGATHREDRAAGLGRLVEYSGATGHPVASEYGVAAWDYAAFGSARADVTPSGTRRASPLPPLKLVQRVDSADTALWDPTRRTVPIKVCAGQRFRIATTNCTRAPQSLQLLGHDVELVGFAGRRNTGIYKDMLTLPSFTRVEFEFDARANEVYLAHSRQAAVEGLIG